MYTALVYTTLVYTALVYTALVYTTLVYTTLVYTALVYTALVYTALVYTALVYTALVYTALALHVQLIVSIVTSVRHSEISKLDIPSLQNHPAHSNRFCVNILSWFIISSQISPICIHKNLHFTERDFSDLIFVRSHEFFFDLMGKIYFSI